MAADPITPPNLTAGTSADSLKSLLGYLSQRSAAADGQATQIFNGEGPAAAYTNAIANQNTSTGLSPQAMAALRTQATSGINDQYQSAAQALNSQLLRKGAIGGNLPSSGADISRTYQPLYSTMEAAKTKGTTDTILADEAAKQKSLYQNQQLALEGANGLYNAGTGMFNAGTGALGQAGGISQALGALEGPNLTKLLLAALGASAATGGGILGGLTSGGGLDGQGSKGLLGDLGSALGIGTNGQKEATDAQKTTDAMANKVGNETATTPGWSPGISATLPGLGSSPTPPPEGTVTTSSTVPEIAAVGSPSATPEIAEALGTPPPGEAPVETPPLSLTSPISEPPANPGGFNPAPYLAGAGLGAAGLTALLGGAAPEIAGTIAPVAAPALASTFGIGAGVGTAATEGGLTFGPVAADAAALAPGGSTGLFGLGMTVPIVGVAVAAIAGITALVKSQAHWEANTWTKGFQKPFDDNMAELSDSFYQGIDSGQMTPQAAVEARQQVEEAVPQYLAQLNKFATEKGPKSDQAKVAKQALDTFNRNYGENGWKFIMDMNLKIGEAYGI